MNILIIGLGGIGTTYGFLFQSVGHNVEHLIRKNKTQYAITDLLVDFLDGREEKRGFLSRNKYYVHKASRKEYDVIFIAVPSGKIAEVIDDLNREQITGTLLFACGIWDDRATIDRLVDGRPYMLGYPVAGGTVDNDMLSCCIFDYFMLEKKDPQIEKLFASCNVRIEVPHDMLEWIWLRMAVTVGLVTVGGSAESLMDSTEKLAQAVRSIRETTHIVASRGVNLKKYRNVLWLYQLPPYLAALVMRHMFGVNKLARGILLHHDNLKDLYYICKSLYDTGKSQDIAAPLFYKNFESLKLLK
ncbi:MAG: hypothetical protein MJ178_11075 [Treponemataceae bacterium]|nr:hypothetical protein [Treponemataceae bacterium]